MMGQVGRRALALGLMAVLAFPISAHDDGPAPVRNRAVPVCGMVLPLSVDSDGWSDEEVGELGVAFDRALTQLCRAGTIEPAELHRHDNVRMLDLQAANVVSVYTVRDENGRELVVEIPDLSGESTDIIAAAMRRGLVCAYASETLTASDPTACLPD